MKETSFRVGCHYRISGLVQSKNPEEAILSHEVEDLLCEFFAIGIEQEEIFAYFVAKEQYLDAIADGQNVRFSIAKLAEGQTVEAREEEPLTIELTRKELAEILLCCDRTDTEDVYRFFREKGFSLDSNDSGLSKIWDTAIANGVIEKSLKPHWLA